MSKKIGILFAKRPAAGKVKTRLANSIGDKRALDIYRDLLHRSFSALQEAADEVLIAWSGEGEQLFRETLFFEQEGVDLGARMLHAISEALKRFPGSHAVLIGADIPLISYVPVEDAFFALKSADVTVGPTSDGGYYLIGMNKPQPYVFHDIAWSTSGVLKATYERCIAAELSFETVTRLADLDDIKDLESSPFYDFRTGQLKSRRT